MHGLSLDLVAYSGCRRHVTAKHDHPSKTGRRARATMAVGGLAAQLFFAL